MKKRSKSGKASGRMRSEYDFSTGVRAKYASRYRLGSNVIVLDPDVAQAFKDSRAVNRALRSLMPTQQRAPKRKAGS